MPVCDRADDGGIDLSLTVYVRRESWEKQHAPTRCGLRQRGDMHWIVRRECYQSLSFA
jgi:hypothetical protein